MSPSAPTSDAAPSPLLRALGTGLVVAAVVAGSVGVARYVAVGEHRRLMLEAAGASADALAARIAHGGLEVASKAASESAALAVVRPGEADEFGIARGAEVALDVRTDARLEPEDGEAFGRALLDRSAALESLVGEGGELPASERLELLRVEAQRFTVAWAPILEGGAYAGAVRRVDAVPPAVDPVPPLRPWIDIGALILLLFGLGRARERIPALRAIPEAVVLVLAGFATAFDVVFHAGLEYAAWTGALAALGAWRLSEGTAALLRGLKEQPRTYAYVAPAIVSLVVLVFIPFGMGIALAFFDADGSPVGLANFTEVLVPSPTADVSFYWTLGVTVLWTASNVVLHVAIGLSLALVLNRPSLRFKGLYRVLLIIPWAVPNYITALVWKGMFGFHDGAVNALLAVFGIDAIHWLGESFGTAFFANLVTNVWLGFPFMMVVALGALQSIPADLYEAARVDGATKLQAFRHITLPLLKPAMVPAIILGSIWTFNMFNVIYLVSAGAPDGETDILITEAYRAFKVLKRYGLAAAYSLVIFAVLYLYGQLTDRISRASEGAYS